MGGGRSDDRAGENIAQLSDTGVEGAKPEGAKTSAQSDTLGEGGPVPDLAGAGARGFFGPSAAVLVERAGAGAGGVRASRGGPSAAAAAAAAAEVLRRRASGAGGAAPPHAVGRPPARARGPMGAWIGASRRPARVRPAASSAARSRTSACSSAAERRRYVAVGSLRSMAFQAALDVGEVGWPDPARPPPSPCRDDGRVRLTVAIGVAIAGTRRPRAPRIVLGIVGASGSSTWHAMAPGKRRLGDSAHLPARAPIHTPMRFSLLLLSAASTRELAIAPHTPVQSPKHGRAGRICLVESEKPRPKKNAFGSRLDADIVGEVRSPL